MRQSTQLTQFYRSYAGWLDDGAKEGMVFYRNHGLCHNLILWCSIADSDLASDLYDEMVNQFVDAKLDYVYPFNKSGLPYFEESRTDGVVTNQQRINWVRQHAE